MKILVKFNKNIATPKQVKSFKVFDLGIVDTTLEDLLNNSIIEIDDLTHPILKIENNNIIEYYIINEIGKTNNLVYPYYTDDFTKDITIDDLILIKGNSGNINVQSDWNQSDDTQDDYIKNKPSIPQNVSDLINDLNFLISSDLNQIAFTGDYDDLINKPNVSTLQQVTDEGNTTTNEIKVLKVSTYNEANENYTTFSSYDNSLMYERGDIILDMNLPDVSQNINYPNQSGTIALQKENFVFVDKKEDLPTAISNVITLTDNRTYLFVKPIDLLGDRLVCGQNTVILGTSSENVALSSTGLTGVALITSNYSLPIRNITITADIALNLDGDGATTALDWFGVNFTNCANVGTIKDYTNHVWTDCAFLESGNLTYNGTIGSIAINSSLFNTASGQTAFIIPSTCTITRRFRANLCAFIIGSGETGVDLSTSASIPNESYILRECNFSGGGTYTTGVLYSDNKSRFRDNIGVANSNEISQYYMNGNVTATTITIVNTLVKVAGTTTSSSVTQRFTNTSNKAVYNGTVTRVFEVNAILSLTGANNHQVGCYIAKNGVVINDSEMHVTTNGSGRAENISLQTLVSLSTNDYIEIFTKDNTAPVSNITVADLNVIIK